MAAAPTQALRSGAAAGHRGEDTNKMNYRHLRPDHLQESIAGAEDYWREVGRFTNAHLRYRRDATIADMAKRRAKIRKNR